MSSNTGFWSGESGGIDSLPSTSDADAVRRGSPVIATGAAGARLISRRRLLGSLGGLVAATLGGASAGTSAKRRPESGGARFGDPRGGEEPPVLVPGRPAASGTVSTAGFPGTFLGGASVCRIDTWQEIGLVVVNRISREDQGTRFLDTLRIHIYDSFGDRLNPAVDISWRPVTSMVWTGKRTFFNRTGAKTWDSSAIEVSIGRNQQYELWQLPFLEDVRAGTPRNVSQNASTYLMV
ncbi:MAG: hypothetical protein ACKOWF_05850 [Chloroflexota bacterium]